MHSWKHITFKQRKLINSLRSKQYRLNEIGDLLSLEDIKKVSDIINSA